MLPKTLFIVSRIGEVRPQVKGRFQRSAWRSAKDFPIGAQKNALGWPVCSFAEIVKNIGKINRNQCVFGKGKSAIQAIRCRPMQKPP